jgi:hypothetical protein
MNKSDLDKIKLMWEKEVDKYLIKAATEDISNYSVEIQQVIKNEVNRRGLDAAFKETFLKKENYVESVHSTQPNLSTGSLAIVGLIIAGLIGKVFGRVMLETMPQVILIFVAVFALYFLLTQSKSQK